MFSLLKRACCEQHNKRVHVYTGLTDDSVSQWKGKGILGLSPLLQYAVEQPSSLDHTKPGCWVWWMLEEATWMRAKVGFFLLVQILAQSAAASHLEHCNSFTARISQATDIVSDINFDYCKTELLQMFIASSALTKAPVIYLPAVCSCRKARHS